MKVIIIFSHQMCIRDSINATIYGGKIMFYNDIEFNKSQAKEILNGINSDLDVSTYARPEFSSNQMKQIRLGMESGG